MHRVAIIEDADDSRDLLYYLLCDEFEVMRYKDGEEALSRLHADLPNLIIMDIRLPGMEGTEVLMRVRQLPALRAVPVLALTANAMAGDREKYLTAGFDEYVSKPIEDLPKFVATVRRLLDRS
jgi:CheY-like chemotaxis protein